MVSLTSLLVLATYFTQTSQNIPKTSYLKLIDIWFVALISQDFCIIMSLVYVETLRLRDRLVGGAVKVFKVSPAAEDMVKRERGFKAPSRGSLLRFWLRSRLPSCPEEVNGLFFQCFSVAIVLMLLCFASVCVYGLYF